MKKAIFIFIALVFLTVTGCSGKSGNSGCVKTDDKYTLLPPLPSAIPIQDASTPIPSADSQSENGYNTPIEHETVVPSLEPVPTYFNNPNVEEYPQLIHSAEEWLSKGYLDYPFNLNDYSYRDHKDYIKAYESVRFYIPQEAIE